MTQPNANPEVEDLTLPVWVKLAAGALALTGVFGIMLAAQLMLSAGERGLQGALQGIVMGQFALGAGAVVMAVFTASGRVWAAGAGLGVALLLAALVVAPVAYGVVAASSFMGAVCGVVSAALLGVSIPSCLRVARAQAKLLDL